MLRMAKAIERRARHDRRVLPVLIVLSALALLIALALAVRH